PSCGYCVLISYSAALRHLHSFPTRRSSDLPMAILGMPGRKIQRQFLLRLPSKLGEAGHLGQIHVGLHVTDGQLQHPLHPLPVEVDRKSTRLNSSHVKSSYAVFCLKKKTDHT